MPSRNYNPLDQLLINLDHALATVFSTPVAQRSNPATDMAEAEMSEAEKRHAAGLMRVNHAGEVCAQALYQGQALTARRAEVRDSMQTASDEENDHLNWCTERLRELDSHTSYLGPLWYGGSLGIGALAGVIGDKWSLGFVAETERQVVRHLQSHLQILPEQDGKSRAIVEQMQIDEGKHASMAVSAGAAELPPVVKRLMTATSKIMTQTAYYL